MAPPKNQKEVRRFVGLVNFYRDLYPRRAEILAPLTTLCGKNTKFQWTQAHQEAFCKMKHTIEKRNNVNLPGLYPAFHCAHRRQQQANQRSHQPKWKTPWLLQQKVDGRPAEVPRHRARTARHSRNLEVLPAHVTSTWSPQEKN
jgi:hypothetical protein